MISAAQIDTQKALAVILENLNKASSEPPAFIPVTDSIYIRRLEKALVKNFDYIRRFTLQWHAADADTYMRSFLTSNSVQSVMAY